jgi:large subunit ribosomal protein L35
MPKMKSHRGAAKRMRRTGSGKIVRAHAFSSHNFEKKRPTRKRRLARIEGVSKPDQRRANRMLGG